MVFAVILMKTQICAYFMMTDQISCQVEKWYRTYLVKQIRRGNFIKITLEIC